jgi:hypothetical protein
MRTSTQRTGLVGCDIQRALLCGSLHSAGGYLGTFTTTTTKLGTTNDYIDDLCCAVIAALWVIEQYSLDLDVTYVGTLTPVNSQPGVTRQY